MGKHIIEEANRCLLCKVPQCKKGCPVSTPVNEVIKLFIDGEIEQAGELLFKNNPLSVVCSLICPHEKFCEGHCVLGKKGSPIHFSSIENYISEYFLDKFQLKIENRYHQKIAIIGSGPAGITVAFVLALKGYDITIFESEEKIGGVLQYGIPDFRLPKIILEK
ncbi:MAG TPA: NAD(P)-binding protein, partial [Bacillota bacterium]|nr:NAD(P)-binding protein [Bacillota bacterium]